jgi:tetratricopeptide (TPR) repeat protein
VCYRRAHLLDPDSFDWLYYLAVVQEAQGKNTEAIRNLRRAARLQPEYTAADLRLADLLLGSGDLDGSRIIYERFAREHPGMAIAQYGLGRVRAASGDIAGATQAFENACELFPGYAAAHYALAAVYRKAGKAPQAEAHTAAYARAGSAGPAREDRLQARVLELDAGALSHIRRGIALDAAGRLEESASAHERALEVDPSLTEAHISLISLYARLGKSDLAEQHYARAIALNSNSAGAHYAYGVLQFGLGRTPKAKEAFARALEANPRHAEAHTNLGYLLMVEGALADAERHFMRALESKPDHRTAHFHLGRLLANRKDYRAAIDHFTRTLKPEDDQTPAYTYALAAAYARLGERAKALECARTAQRKAAALGQSELLASVERDIRILERRR